jgi:stearoyl-CoA desaturase (Delta-9 desaturase)
MTLFLVVFIISYLYHGLGITLGYHRLLSHRSFSLPKPLEYLLVSGGYLAFEGSPIFWVTTHRLHHRFSDQPGDPHSPKDGLWHSFLGWMLKPRIEYNRDKSERLCPDLCKDKLYNFLHLNHTRWHALLCLAACIAFRVLIYLALGPVAVAANIAAALAPFVGALLVNSIGHMPRFGYTNFETGEDSRNNFWIAMLSLGEGWHNNHHALPSSARHGLLRQEFDLSYLVLVIMSKLGLATAIKLPDSRQLSRNLSAESRLPRVRIPEYSEIAKSESKETSNTLS